MSNKLCIVMVGLPARGKSTVALRLCEGLLTSGVNTRIFNNGNLRRQFIGKPSASPEFYAPENEEGRLAREQIAMKNVEAAKDFFENGGKVAILDATNASRTRRKMLEQAMTAAPILYIECENSDPSLLEASIHNKAGLAEFSHLKHEEAITAFKERIGYYQRLYVPLSEERCFMRIDTLSNSILEERFSLDIPFYITIRDILVSDWVRDLYLARHGQSIYNVESRIGGDASLTKAGKLQAEQLAASFIGRRIPYIFTSRKKRSIETAEPLKQQHPEARCIVLDELDEIDSGICDSMRYEDIKNKMPEEYAKRMVDKYNYCYPKGEGYASMRNRVERGFRKALFLAGGQPGIVLIGHQAVNRMILSLFLFRRLEDVPYIFVPQDQYFHIMATYKKKLFELEPFIGGCISGV